MSAAGPPGSGNGNACFNGTPPITTVTGCNVVSAYGPWNSTTYGGTLQSYPSMRQLSASTANRLWFSDKHAANAGSNGGFESPGQVGNITYSLVGGT